MTNKDAIAILTDCLDKAEYKYGAYGIALKMAIKALEQEPKTGHWITKPHVYGVTYCSECDFELKIDNTNFCPNCGAKMVEPQERSDKE